MPDLQDHKLWENYLEYERKMLGIIAGHWNIKICETPKDRKSICDGFIIRNNEVVAFFESKAREMSEDKLKNKFHTLMVDLDKMKSCIKISRLLKIPFLCFFYLIDDDKIFYCKITDREGNKLIEYEEKRKRARINLFGGTREKDKALIHWADLIKIKQEK